MTKGAIGIGTNFFGGWGGEALGATVGSAVFPGIGTFLGGMIGGVYGAYKTSQFADSMVDDYHDKFGDDVCETCKDYAIKTKEEIAEEHKCLMEQLEEIENQKKNTENNNKNLQEKLEEKSKELEEEIRNHRDKYIESHPIPKFLEDHQRDNPNTFYIQVIGARGSGKSTFMNRIFKHAQLRSVLIFKNFLG